MKYQYKLNGQIVFETNDVSEFFRYLITDEDAQQAKNSILFNLLNNSGGYICNMATQNQ